MGDWVTYCAVCCACFSKSDVYPDSDPESYDADVLAQNGHVDWLDDLYIFGYNPQASGEKQTFFTGPGFCSPWGEIKIFPETDLDSPFRNYRSPVVLSAYAAYDYGTTEELNMPSVYPIHPGCFHDLLRRCLTGSRNGHVDEDRLFYVFQGLATDRDLQVDYGVPSPPRKQFWEPQRGHEAVVANPVEIPQLANAVGDLWELLSGVEEEQGLETAGCTARDPFYELPIDLRLEIFQHLPTTSILAVRVASGAMRSTAIFPKWWQRKIQSDKPWLWELQSVVPTESTATARCLYDKFVEIDSKSRYDETSNCFWGGLVNRQRIWNVCEQIKTVYNRQLAEQT